MNNIIEDNDEDQFANGQSSRDLRVSSDAKELETQLMETIDNIRDFLRFVEVSSRAFAHVAVVKPRCADPHATRSHK